MNSFNNKLIAIMLALVLPLSASLAHAAGRSSASSGGFRGGFSSQRSISKPAPSAPSKTGFGSFNTSKPAYASKKSDSALNRDLEKNQAQANAQKSMDARQQTAQQSQRGFGNSVSGNNGVNNSGNQQAANQSANQPANQSTYATPPVTQSAPVMMQPQVAQRGSGILPAVVGGVILGSVMSHPQAAENRQSQQLEPIANIGTGSSKDEVASSAAAVGDKTLALSSSDAENAAATVTATATKVTQENGDFKLLRTVLVILLFAALAWAGWQFLLSRRNRRNKRNKQDSAVHYSLGGN
ncbi:hypothetical protein ACO0LL_27075 [Undibacterium sp. TC4M20W]|uniref:hypothetical protein n=1 Tax=Undibacterium sp. TC4M20W TaxID=3413052 RepID=UPI003BF24E10